jgi:hypothetical protein
MSIETISPEIANQAIALIHRTVPDYLRHPNTLNHLTLLNRRGRLAEDDEILIDKDGLCHGGIGILLWIQATQQPAQCRVEVGDFHKLVLSRVYLRNRTGIVPLRRTISDWFDAPPLYTATMGVLLRHISVWGEALPAGDKKVPVKAPNVLQVDQRLIGALSNEHRTGDHRRIDRIRDAALHANLLAGDHALRYRRMPLGPANFVWLLYADSEANSWLQTGGGPGGHTPGLDLPTSNLIDTLDRIETILVNATPKLRNTYGRIRANQFMPYLANAMLEDKIERRNNKAAEYARLRQQA